MPVSKRDKKVSLTKTLKKGMAMKQQLVEDIRKYLDKYDNLFVFTINNMRNGPLKNLREEWKDSRFFFAKKKVMAIALGRTEAEAVHKNIHKVASNIEGQCGLLFTDKAKDQVLQWFREYTEMEFAKSGFIATETVMLPAGPLPEFSFALEPHLRSLGLPTQMEKGKIILREDYNVCTKGVRLTPEQASILKLLGKRMAEFKVKISCAWSKDGSFERFKIHKETQKATPKKNTPSQNKTKTAKLDSKTEKEISQLFDHQRISEPETEVDEEMENSEIDETISLTESAQKDSKKPTKAKIDHAPLSEKSKKLIQNEEQKNIATTGSSKKKTKSPKTKIENKNSNIEPEELIESEDQYNIEEVKQVDESPKITRATPRRSLRTPKPIKRTPEQKTQSVKKLTESSKRVKGTLKGGLTKQTKGTPRKSINRKISKDTEDVEMAE